MSTSLTKLRHYETSVVPAVRDSSNIKCGGKENINTNVKLTH